MLRDQSVTFICNQPLYPIAMPEVVDGERQISGTDTSKRGYPIVSKGTRVDCPHCDEIHVTDIQEDDVGMRIPGGHKRHSHWTCENTEQRKRFAAKAGSKR